ncbi:amidohydrolase [Subtercola sp. PAMC28395]|uniref:amidohydrolase n=1 Tax=Subtercola sp. PAMC28395 TaxID=2846775 RepID=UPI001C0BD654|nr:amidohydrolase [Subtercola sp. PAMC28395]QWT22697.1 amidohydrolase [Subtercola sp. PAMC28395]
MTDSILTAGTIITMDESLPRAEAVAVSGGVIVAVGSLAEAQEALPGAQVIDTGAAVLMPGFIESHGHPIVSGQATQAPARSISPWDAPTWNDVLAIFAEAITATPADVPLLFNGFDALLHGIEHPTALSLDAIFGERLVAVADNSGHGVYFTTALIASQGWDAQPPADPVGGSFGRNTDGSLDGTAYELPAVLAVVMPVMAKLGGNPLHPAMAFYRLMAEAGITSASEMTYNDQLKGAYEALAVMSNVPLRLSAYHVSVEASCAEPLVSDVSTELLVKQGIKLWADGSPWIGNVATSFGYLDTETTRRAKIDRSVAGEHAMNYSRADLDAILDKHALSGWQISVHVNGDLGLDIVLDAIERALVKYRLLGTDHRWRVEHVGAGRKDQFERAARLGVAISMGPFQFYYWGDMLDGEMFESEYGSQWQAFRDAFSSGATVSFHNDGAVTPPTPLLNVQTAVTRRTRSGALRGANQAISVHEGLAAETINAAFLLKRDHLVGSIAVGKLADFVELSADPYDVDPRTLATDVMVLGTWLGGGRIDLDVFMGESHGVDQAQHADLSAHVASGHRC